MTHFRVPKVQLQNPRNFVTYTKISGIYQNIIKSYRKSGRTSAEFHTLSSEQW